VKSRTKYKRELSRKWIREGRCRNCGGRDVVLGRKLCRNCGKRSLDSTRRYREKNPDAFRRKYHALKKAEICTNCAAHKAVVGVLCFVCNLAEKQRAVRIKQEVIDRYGGRCSCCKEKRIAFLTLDHVKNNGTALRRLGVHAGGGQLYKRLRTKPIDPAFQVLCWNCNMGKRVTGTCPHKDDSYFRKALNRVNYERVQP
jgi:hypothetical protein